MMNRGGLNRDEFTPGSEVFRSDRWFVLWAYSPSHSQLLFRSPPGTYRDRSYATTIDLLFNPVEAIKIRTDYDGLLIRCATEDEATQIKTTLPDVNLSPADPVLMLESRGVIDYVVSMGVGWREGILQRTQHSFYSNASAYMPIWPTQPLDGVFTGFNVASVEDLIKALGPDHDDQHRPDRFRMVYVLMTRLDTRSGPDIFGAGVFLTETDAEEARAQLAPKVSDCWIETLPISI